MKYLVLLQHFCTKMHTGNLHKSWETERDAVKYKKSKTHYGCPWEKNDSNTDITSHTSLHSAASAAYELHSQENTKEQCALQDPGPHLTSAQRQEATAAYRESWYWRELGPTMRLLSLQRFFFLEWDQFICWNFWWKGFTLGSWLNLTFCHPTSQDTHVKFCASQS